jgi:hypothetical protein
MMYVHKARGRHLEAYVDRFEPLICVVLCFIHRLTHLPIAFSIIYTAMVAEYAGTSNRAGNAMGKIFKSGWHSIY